MRGAVGRRRGRGATGPNPTRPGPRRATLRPPAGRRTVSPGRRRPAPPPSRLSPALVAPRRDPVTATPLQRALERLQDAWVRARHGRDLDRLAGVYGSDKWGEHFYTPHYARHFGPLRRRPLTLLEIGIGGYDDPRAGGASLRMWRAYFPRARIHGIDIHDKSAHDGRRIRTYRGDQTDAEFLERLVGEIGRPDIVIDDGSHLNAHVVATFEILFPLLADDGLYVVEDTQTSYWPGYGGSVDRDADAGTSMGFLKRLADGLNHAEFGLAGYAPTYYDRHVVALHFYHNLVVVEKGLNDEPSNAPLHLRQR